MVKQSITGIFDQVEHLLKTSFPTIVRVWYHCGVELAAEFSEPPQLASLCRRAVLLGQRKIVPVHREQ